MKTNFFNVQRIGLLFQRYFVENFRSELIYWGIMTIAFVFLRNNTQMMSSLIMIAGAFFAARFFREIHHPSNSLAYFMIPATQLEKITVAIVLTTLYYFAMMMIAYVIGNLTGTLLNNVLASLDFLPNAMFHHSSMQWDFLREATPTVSAFKNDVVSISASHSFFLGFLFFQSLFLFGGIYFRKNQTFKTFAVFILFFVVLGIFIGIEAKLILGDFQLAQKDFDPFWGRMIESAAKIFFYLLPPFFWIVSYFRLTEKQS